MHWFKKCNFLKKSLSPFRSRWGQEVIFEVAGFQLVFTTFHLEFLSFSVSMNFDLGDLRRGSGNFFKIYIFKISAFQGKRWGTSRLSSQIFLWIPGWIKLGIILRALFKKKYFSHTFRSGNSFSVTSKFHSFSHFLNFNFWFDCENRSLKNKILIFFSQSLSY